VRQLSLLSWNDKKRTRVALSGMVAAAALAASGTVVVAASPPAPGPSPVVRVIVRARPGGLSAVDSAITQAGGELVEQIPLVTASVAEVPSGDVGWLAEQPAVADVTPDGTVQLSSAGYSAPADSSSLYSLERELGITQAWSDGYTGQGVGVALIDTGVSPVEGLDEPLKLVDGPDLSFDASNASLRYLDENGHGTFMAGIIAGRDPSASRDRYATDSTDFLGVAPDAHILSVKVAGADGAVDVSQVLAAIDWVVQHRDDLGLNIRVLNLSFGTDSTQSYLLDPLAYAAEQAWRHGIVVVAAAGNQGVSADGVADPAIDPYVIAVGASELGPGGNFTVAPFSSRGDALRSPDLLAPGKSVVSLADPGSLIYDQYGATGKVGTRFFRGSGTSEATAIVSGIAALLVEEHPDATPDQIKALLTSTTAPIKNPSFRATGYGEVMAGAAVEAPLSDAVQRWAPSIGTGSLELARGTMHVAIDGIVLRGARDIFGNPVDAGALAALEAQADSWSAGVWNGARWTGDHWTLDWHDHTVQWAYTAWTADSWAGIPWSRVATATGVWDGVSWSGTSWSGTSWSGVTWSGVTWSGTSWTGDTWTTVSWS
jgi:serine protease AprX